MHLPLACALRNLDQYCTILARTIKHLKASKVCTNYYIGHKWIMCMLLSIRMIAEIIPFFLLGKWMSQCILHQRSPPNFLLQREVHLDLSQVHHLYLPV